MNRGFIHIRIFLCRSFLGPNAGGAAASEGLRGKEHTDAVCMRIVGSKGNGRNG